MRLQELFKQDIDEARGSCWRGYEQKGYKKKGDRNVPNCVKEDINEDRDVTDQELQQLEVYADKMFASLGIDVEFSRHFKDRVNDPRNKKPITIAELTRLFKQIYKKHGKPIAQLGPDAEAVMKDMRTDVNVPFALQWDGKELDLVAKTIMRKPNFATPNPEFAVEGKRIPRKKGQPAGSKKHSDLYTDENPKGTIQGLKFATVKDAEASVSKIRSSGKKHAHKIQAAVAMEQRAKAAGKTSAAAVYRKFINSMKKKTKAMKESLVEAYMMDLNQDEDMLVLKVMDTDKPGHVEIRGKKNYETDGYDPKDPLHKVLDQLDPATVAKLYGNEEPVFLNPKNPRTEKTIAKAMQLMKEHGLVPMYHTMKAYKMTKAKHPDGSAYFKSDYPKTNENFADGKKKGKSRPGRVKRAGASCKGSVTSLRAKAKKSSGERAKMYHWCANMKSGRKKSESLYTQDEFFSILLESTPQQLEEGIADILKKLPKNILGKVMPVIKKIPKTAKNLTLMAVLLGTMVNAVAAGDMQKINTPLDKLNNMATMSTTMDTGTDVGPGHTMPDNIDPIKMTNVPDAPNGGGKISNGGGTYTFGADGKLQKWETPKIGGYAQTHDFEKNTITVNFTTATDGVGIDQTATYDMSGKLISKDHTGVKSGGVSIGIGGDGNKSIKYNAGGGEVYNVNTADMPAAKKTLAKFQGDINKAKDKSAPFQNKAT